MPLASLQLLMRKSTTVCIFVMLFSTLACSSNQIRFFILVLFSTAIDKRKKLTGKLSKCKLGGSSNLLFLLLNTFKTIFSYRFCQKSGNDVNSKGRRGGGSNSLRHIKANRYGNRCIH